ncbi:hypothetical protein NDU88_002203 [Pleurodeles waltl]|uniref:Uncharacterized protein n=1 Tax=Pleurodeles waltl TaxID=8319 RepID=A0AAV7T270_PLEWA|nr:hypothetical protein NDU88_002203 [Pleurodeles waltl]
MGVLPAYILMAFVVSWATLCLPLCAPLLQTMGRHKARQDKLNFGGRGPTWQAGDEAQHGAFPERTGGADCSNVALKELLDDVKTTLKATDMKLDILTKRLDQVKQRVDKHEHRLDLLEGHVSDTDDNLTESKVHLLKMDKVLGIIKAKNEDL